MNGESLRVMVVHNRYRSGQPSGEDRVVDQEKSLLADAGHDVSSFERRSDDITAMSLPARALVPLRVPYNGSARADLSVRLRVERPDIVHIHNTFPLLSPSVVDACADFGVAVVATLHNYLPICPSGTLYREGRVCTDCTGRLPLPALRHGCYRGSRLATLPLTINMLANRSRWWSGVARFFCISEAQRTMLIQGGMPAQRLQTKLNFVVDSGIRRHGRGEHLLYLGRMAEEKGVRLLMAAWDRLAVSDSLGIPLVLAGAGPLGGEVANWAQHHEDVSYLGLRSAEECASLMAQAVAVVAPSMWLEPLGLTVLEAMAARVPAVAAAHGAFVETVDDRRTGLLHRPGDVASLADCLRHVALDVEANLAMGVAARRLYEQRFTPRQGLVDLIAGYRQAIDHAGYCEPV